MKLSLYQTYNGVGYERTICERNFIHETALYDHCRQTSRHAWCERCSRVFLLTAAKETHLRESSAHNLCSICPQYMILRPMKTFMTTLWSLIIFARIVPFSAILRCCFRSMTLKNTTFASSVRSTPQVRIIYKWYENGASSETISLYSNCQY